MNSGLSPSICANVVTSSSVRLSRYRPPCGRMDAMASRAAWHGPRGFSLESIMTASAACGGRFRAAAASMGSLTIWKALAADAAADNCRNERREKRGMRDPLGQGVYQRSILTSSRIKSLAMLHHRCRIRVMERVRRKVGGGEPQRPQLPVDDP